jgi:hypothetical protein
VAEVIVEKSKSLRHPHVETTVRMFGDFANDVHAIAQPPKFAASGHGKDRDFAIFTLISVLHTASYAEPSEFDLHHPLHENGPHSFE